MPGKSRKERAKANAVSAGALALQLAQDKKFRDRLLSAIEHGYAAGQRTRRGLGWRGTEARLAADLAKASKVRQPAWVGHAATRFSSDDSRVRPRRLENLTKEELYARAQEADTPGRSEMSKEQLIEALRATS
jgi:hypothetical protein